MRLVRPCSSCAGPVTVKMVRCPSCDQVNVRGILTRVASAVATLVGGLTVSGTLAACYGAPCAEPDDPECRMPEVVPTCAMVSGQPQIDDADGDGYCRAYDCNEADKKINAVAVEIPNDAIDQNCNGSDSR